MIPARVRGVGFCRQAGRGSRHLFLDPVAGGGETLPCTGPWKATARPSGERAPGPVLGQEPSCCRCTFDLPPSPPLPSQAHNDLLRTYEAKLAAFGIPLDNLGFKPLETSVLGQALGQGPAGLVATPT